MYIEEVQGILNKLGGYLKIVGVKAGITEIPYQLHGNYFLKIEDIDKSQLKQATNLMSEGSSTFTLAAAKRLKYFAGEMDSEYAECAAEVIVALAELDKLHASKQCEKKVAGFKNAATKAYNRLKGSVFNLCTFNSKA